MVFVVLSIYNFESRVKDKDQAKFEAEDITEEVLEYDSKNLPNVANIEMTPNDAKNNGKDWKFVVNYDVKRPADGNDVQIGAGKFVHYFSADNLPTMPKHIIFVLDIRLFHVIAKVRFLYQCSDHLSHSKNFTSLFPLIFLSKHISLYALGRLK